MPSPNDRQNHILNNSLKHAWKIIPTDPAHILRKVFFKHTVKHHDDYNQISPPCQTHPHPFIPPAPLTPSLLPSLPSDTRACLKNHFRNLHAPLCGIFCPNSVAVARYDALIRTKSPTNCDTHLAKSIFQTHSKSQPQTSRGMTEHLRRISRVHVIS